MNEVDRVTELLAPLAGERTDLPSADAVYWRAQARLAIEAARRRRRRDERPLRLLHRALGVAGILAALIAAVSPWVVSISPGAAQAIALIVIGAASAGAWSLSEA